MTRVSSQCTRGGQWFPVPVENLETFSTPNSKESNCFQVTVSQKLSKMKQREKKKTGKKNKARILVSGRMTSNSLIYYRELESSKEETENTFEELMAENISNMKKIINLQILQARET